MIDDAWPAGALLMDDARPGGAAQLFAEPLDWIEAHTPEEAEAALVRIDSATAAGRWVAGAFAFELGFVLEPRLRPLFRPGPEPLIAAGVYRAARTVDGAQTLRRWVDGRNGAAGAVIPAWHQQAYETAFARTHAYIAAGDIYQLNLTWPLSIQFEGDALGMVAQWRARARAGHGAYLRLKDRDILSFSPELFLAGHGDGRIVTRPMKGTTARMAGASEDRLAAAALAADPKQRAENLMIVDLLRNDLSRICRPGTVSVDALFAVETFPTLHAMTTSVSGQMEPRVHASDILKALFPCGSVTGAPKVRAMEIIAELEAAPRGIYCGAIGAFGPNQTMNLNVAIRTLVHRHGEQHWRMGVGGGVVFDSRAEAEYREGQLKARFATAAGADFALLETMRWSPCEGFLFLGRHLERLAASAAYFLRPLDLDQVRKALDEATSGLRSDHRVRLLIDAAGVPRVETAALDDSFSVTPDRGGAPDLKVMIASARLDPRDPLVRHKTTARAPYEAALAEAKAKGADEAILLNVAGRVADGSFTTVFVRRQGALMTPPPGEGALDGVLKQALRAASDTPVIERRLAADDLVHAEALYVGNSVRGLKRARLVT